MHRRLFMRASAAVPLVLGALPTRAQVPDGRGKTYVLVHGSWCGGWFWAPVAERLRAQGHRVFTPTHTGLGERKHLLSRDITLATFIVDLVNVIEAEELRDVILVGHSSAGAPITGVADQMPDRVRHLIYLDAFVLQNGQSSFDTLPPEVADARRKASRQIDGVAVLPPPLGALATLGISEGATADWVRRRMTPQPLATYETALKLGNSPGNRRPCTYVAFTSPAAPGPEPSRRWARNQEGWHWAELAVGHAGPILAPDKVAQTLAEIS